MPSNIVPVSQLIDSCAQLSWQESVALVRSLAALGTSRHSRTTSSGTFEEFVIHENGEVMFLSPDPPALSVSELALLLTRLLPGGERNAGADVVEGGDRAPAALHFTIARALALVGAPSYASVEEFSAALARFQQARPSFVLRRMFERCLSAIESTQAAREHRDASEGGTVSYTRDAGERFASRLNAEGVAAPFTGPDRRRTRMPSDVLRRLLREEDRQNFLDRHSRAAASPGKRDRKAGPDAQMLRRFIREADERTYTLIRDMERRAAAPRVPRQSRRTGYHAAFALLLLLVLTTTGIVERRNWWPAIGEPVMPASRGASASPQTAAAATAASETALNPVTPQPVGTEAAPATGRSPVVVSPADANPNAVTPTATRGKRARSADAPKRGTKPRAVVGVSSRRDAPGVRRRGRLPRFFAAVYHRLGGLVRRDANARPSSD